MRLPDVLPVPAQLPREDVVLVPHVSLQAILVLDSPDVDIRLWNATVAEMETSGKLRDWCALRRSPIASPPRVRMFGPGLTSCFACRCARRNVNINFGARVTRMWCGPLPA
jgi:hypothetical protein